MRILEFLNLPRLKNEDDFSLELKTGDCFLYGPKMISQIETKKENDEVSFFKAFRIEGKKVEYGLQFDRLQPNLLKK